MYLRGNCRALPIIYYWLKQLKKLQQKQLIFIGSKCLHNQSRWKEEEYITISKDCTP